MPTSEQQRQLDTEALAMASKALALIEKHEHDCQIDRAEALADRKDMRSSVRRMHERIDKLMVVTMMTLASAIGGLLILVLSWIGPGG